MKRIILGNTGQLISELCLGTMYFGTKLDQDKSEAILEYFYEAGGNFIDTANNYAFWRHGASGDESELVIGKWLKSKPRDRLIIATKCGARPTDYHGDLESIQFEGLSYETIIKSVEASLKRLQTDYIDILYAHIDFLDTPIEERLIAFTKLQEQGKVRYSGISNTESWRVAQSQDMSQTNNYIRYSCVQQKFSYLRPKRSADLWVQKLLNPEMLNYAEADKYITLIAYSTLLSGGYSKPYQELPEDYKTTDNRLRMALLNSLAEAKGCTKNQLVLAWMLQQNAKVVPIISGSQVKQIEESLGAITVRLNDHEINLLNKAGE